MACERPPAGRFAPAAVPLGEGDNYSPLDFISFRSVGKLVSPSTRGDSRWSEATGRGSLTRRV